MMLIQENLLKNNIQVVYTHSGPGQRSRYSESVRADGPWIEFHWRQDYPYPSSPVSGATQPPARWEMDTPGDKVVGAWLSPPTPSKTPRIKKEYSYSTTPSTLELHGRLWSEFYTYTHMSITVNRTLKRVVEKEDSNIIDCIINSRLLSKLPPKLRLPLFIQLATPSSASLPSM